MLLQWNLARKCKTGDASMKMGRNKATFNRYGKLNGDESCQHPSSAKSQGT